MHEGAAELAVVIPGKPIAKARPRFFRRGKFVGTYKAQGQDTAEGRFLVYMTGQISLSEPLRGPVSVSCGFYMPRPKAHYGTGKNARILKNSAPKRHAKKPDLDNLIKFVLDCLNMSGVWTDDNQVYKIESHKVYSSKPRTEIIIKHGGGL